MTKRITAVFLVLTVLLLSGCADKRLTLEEYRDELQSRLRDYTSSVMDISSDMRAFDESGVKPSEFEKHSKACEKAINSFEKIRPPADMVYRHEWLLEAFDFEREWLEAVRALMLTKTPAEKEQAEQRIQDIITAAAKEKVYLERYVEIVKELPSEDGSLEDFFDNLRS